jgi:hypothetical protein
VEKEFTNTAMARTTSCPANQSATILAMSTSSSTAPSPDKSRAPARAA